MVKRVITGSPLLLRVGLVTLVPLLVLAVVLSKSLTGAMRDQALAEAQREAVVVERLVGPQRLARIASAGETTRLMRRVLDRELRPLLRDGGAVRVAVLGPDGRLVYSAGQRSDGEETIAASVPLGSDRAEAPAGALAVDLPYEPVRAAMAADARRLQLILLVGLLMLGAGLLRTATRAASRLREQADENERQALQDSLTGLPNRALFNRLLEEALSARGREGIVAAPTVSCSAYRELFAGRSNGVPALTRG